MPFSWSATDATSSVDHYDVELSRNGAPFAPLLTATTATSTAVTGAEGEQLTLRVRAADSFGNLSGWSEQTVGIDATPPNITIGAAIETADGTLTVPVGIANTGSPATATYTFGPPGSRRVNSGPVTGATVHYGFTRLPSTTYPVLTVTATDALGRAVTATRTFTVAGSLRDANLRLNRAIARGGYLRLSGSINSGARGKVSVTATRIGTKGTKRARKSFRIVSGRYSGRLRLAPGRYRLRVAYRGSKSVNAAVARKTVRLR